MPAQLQRISNRGCHSSYRYLGRGRRRSCANYRFADDLVALHATTSDYASPYIAREVEIPIVADVARAQLALLVCATTAARGYAIRSRLQDPQERVAAGHRSMALVEQTDLHTCSAAIDVHSIELVLSGVVGEDGESVLRRALSMLPMHSAMSDRDLVLAVGLLWHMRSAISLDDATHAERRRRSAGSRGELGERGELLLQETADKRPQTGVRKIARRTTSGRPTAVERHEVVLLSSIV